MTNFTGAGFEVIVADFLTAATCEIYRPSAPQALLVQLTALREEVRRRATTRRVHLTDDEFEHLHDPADQPLAVDHVLDADLLSPSEQLDAVREIWEAAT